MFYRFFYCLLIYLAMPFILLHLCLPRKGKPGYGKRWPELLGWTPRPQSSRKPLWIHTVSVGESLAAMPLLRAIKQAYPELPLLITTTTPTGAEQIAKLGDLVIHNYAPLDYPDAIHRFLKRVDPCGLLIMETELWPNWLAACGARTLPVVVMNARLSERSCQRYQKIRGIFATMSRHITALLCQTREDAARFQRLGIPQSRIQITGSLKFDIQLDDDLIRAGQALKTQLAPRLIWIAASTHHGEDEQVLVAHRQLLEQLPESLLILVPRHPQRFEQVAKLCTEQGWEIARRSQQQPVTTQTQIYLADTMGEMPLLFQAADVAFMGGSLVPIGGHNLLEPASLGKPTLIGPHYFNFSDITKQLSEKKCCRIIQDSHELALSLQELLQDAALCQQIGMRAFDVVNANQGAKKKTLAAIGNLFHLGTPS